MEVSQISEGQGCKMNTITKGILRLALRPQTRVLAGNSIVSSPCLQSAPCVAIVQHPISSLHTSAFLGKKHREPTEVEKSWKDYNDIVYPPRKPGEPLRPAEVTHQWENIKYSGKKLWYISLMIRGMSIDEAVKQLSFVKRQGGSIVKEILLEAQEMAVKDHNVEFKSNLWIADTKVRFSYKLFGMRKCARGRYNRLDYRYHHFMVRLREGKPPKQYYYDDSKRTGNEILEEHLAELRARHIRKSL